MRLIVDIEADSLYPLKVKNIWCICAKDIDTGDTYAWTNVKELPNELIQADLIVGHNFIGYDYPVLSNLFPGKLDPESIADTLVLSRLLKYKLDDDNGHSLEAWGVRFGSPKHPSPDFSVYSDSMLEYCKQDVEINYQLYKYLKEHLDRPEFYQAIETETAMAWICQDMHENGFKYDKSKADNLQQRLLKRLEELDSQLHIPDRIVPVREVMPKLTKQGTLSRTSLPRDWVDLTSVHAGCPFTLIRYEKFNPASSSQLVDVLNKAGWKPVEPTKTGKGWKINEVNLATLPEGAPEGVRKLVERILVAARTRTLKEWEAAYEPNTGRIHGSFNSIGTWPGRMSHSRPNMGNVATKKSIKYKGAYLKKLAMDLGEEMRQFWICDEDSWLVGTDMEGAHVRLFAHYIDDPIFTRALVTGDKKKGTDVHSLNKEVLGDVCPDRDLSKTFLFSFFNGAGASKVAETFGCSMQEARRALQDFNQRYPGIRRLKEELIPGYAGQGWFPGLDKRLVTCSDSHLMFAGMLQSGEAIVMKMANVIWRKQLREEGIPFKQVNLVHDEYVTEVTGSRDVAEYVGRVQSDSIKQVGERLGLRCPLAGESKIGKNWLEVH